MSTETVPLADYKKCGEALRQSVAAVERLAAEIEKHVELRDQLADAAERAYYLLSREAKAEDDMSAAARSLVASLRDVGRYVDDETPRFEQVENKLGDAAELALQFLERPLPYDNDVQALAYPPEKAVVTSALRTALHHAGRDT